MTQHRRATNIEVALVALYNLGGGEKRVHTEDVALECYRLAPGQFSWRKYPKYPDCDIARVYLSEARKKKRGILVSFSGPSEREGLWMLTAAGLQWVRSRANVLGRALTLAQTQPSSRQYAQRGLNEVMSHRAFQIHEREGSCATVEEADFVDSLKCTLNSSPRALRARIDKLRAQAQAHDCSAVIGYLDECERRFARLLRPVAGAGHAPDHHTSEGG
jgi:hypothetical protein